MPPRPNRKHSTKQDRIATAAKAFTAKPSAAVMRPRPKGKPAMPEREVCSPVTRKGGKVGSNPPRSPGARTSPSRVRGDAEPATAGGTQMERAIRDARRRKGQEPARAKVTGPED
jgi:hypothetical protein